MLNFFAALVYQKYRPKVIVVTGTAGKSVTVDFLYQALSKDASVYKTQYHKRHSVGIPLTFLLEKTFNPFKVLAKFLSFMIFPWYKKYPVYIVLEFGFENPKIVSYWAQRLDFDVLVITSIGDIPPFAEVFAGPESLQKKKELFARAIKPGGLIVLNGDDISVFEIGEHLQKIAADDNDPFSAEVVYFGITSDSAVRAENYEIVCEKNAWGSSFSLYTPQGTKDLFLQNIFGKGSVYSALATATVLLKQGYEFEHTCSLLLNLEALHHRMKLYRSRKGYIVLDNTFHISSASIWESLDVLSKMPGERKVCVIGDLLHTGKYALELHQKIGKIAADMCDVFVGIGVRSKFAVDEVKNKKGRAYSAVHFFEYQLKDIEAYLMQELQAGDVVLLAAPHELQLYHVSHTISL